MVGNYYLLADAEVGEYVLEEVIGGDGRDHFAQGAGGGADILSEEVT